MHNVSQLVCKKSSFWGDFGIIITQSTAPWVLSLTQRNVGHLHTINAKQP
jgi:hypothetical protein